jgi:hypothetical protein
VLIDVARKRHHSNVYIRLEAVLSETGSRHSSVASRHQGRRVAVARPDTMAVLSETGQSSVASRHVAVACQTSESTGVWNLDHPGFIYVHVHAGADSGCLERAWNACHIDGLLLHQLPGADTTVQRVGTVCRPSLIVHVVVGRKSPLAPACPPWTATVRHARPAHGPLSRSAAIISRAPARTRQ